jgi:deoxyribodipyrimidine photolyase-related protein
MKQSLKQQQKKKQKHFNTLRNIQLSENIKKTTLLLFPNQLFEINKLTEILTDNKVARIIFIEHPLYYGYTAKSKLISKTTTKKYNYNKIKIIYHIAANLYYLNEIISSIKKNILIDFIELFDYMGFNKLRKKLKIINTIQEPIIYIDTLNTELNNEIKREFKENIELDSPLLLTSKKDLESYSKKHKGRQNHSSFYKWQKQRLKILTEEKKTYDIQQRIPKKEYNKIPDISPITSIDKKYLTQALNKFIANRDYISIFDKNPGPSTNEISIDENFLFPVSHQGSTEYLQYFISKKFNNFTKYQDSIVPGHERNKSQLYHAGISPMMNTGLLLAEDILDVAKKAFINNKNNIDISSYESFIRQIIGWREYQYYIYCFHREKLEQTNYFENTNKLSAVWYSGSTGIQVVDDAIKVAFRYGYLHHIMRLMVVCNFMNLCMINPKEVFRWFMEFSLDSYEWVMYCNVYSMGIWSDGGVAMRKPYIASDAYIAKMSNYLQVSKADKVVVKRWMKVWYALYYNFINVKQKQIKKTYYAGMIKNWQNKSTQEQKELTQIANDFFDSGYVLDKKQDGGHMINDEQLNKFINENMKKITEFKNNCTNYTDLELLKKNIKTNLLKLDEKKYTLIDIIYKLNSNGLEKKTNIWIHGNDNMDIDELINTITAGIIGKHYYCLIVDKKLYKCLGSFLRN